LYLEYDICILQIFTLIQCFPADGAGVTSDKRQFLISTGPRTQTRLYKSQHSTNTPRFTYRRSENKIISVKRNHHSVVLSYA